MNKIKVVNKAGKSQIIIKSLKGQQLNENEVFAINSDKVEGLVPLDVDFKDTTFKLIYDTTGLVTMRNYLKYPLNKEGFAWILQSVLWNLESMEKVFFNQQYLLLDVDMVMVNPRTRQIYFVYVPILFYESGYALRDFLLNIIQCASFQMDEDTGYVQDYLAILNAGKNFSMFDLEQYINKLLGQKAESPKSEERSQNIYWQEQPVKSFTATQAKASSQVSSNAVYDPLAETYKHYSIHEEAAPKAKVQKPVQSVQSTPYAAPVVKPKESFTEMLGAEEVKKPRVAYLRRVRTGECIQIQKSPFRIGKESGSNDYAVPDNPAISRKHAEITVSGDRYFISDLKSTNKTYVNGRAIMEGQREALSSDARVRLANEDFVFILK